eukprot:COSAG01_NODE_55131_length_327_cov_0.802632_1_plen_83_part_01
MLPSSCQAVCTDHFECALDVKVVSAEREHPNLFLVYFEKAMTSKLFIRDATGAQPYSLLLFGGEIGVQHEHGTITVADWITYS